MILFQNSILQLDYNPATDVLSIFYPDLHDYLIPEIKNSIDVLVDHVRNYDVKNLLLDSSRTHIGVDSVQSREVSLYLAAGLIKTRVQKLARVQSESEPVEQTAHHNISHIRDTISLPFQLQNFTNRQEALEWLAKDHLAIDL